MLTHLTIKNYALIRHLELDPSAHLNVITGETGAGKSIMLGAIGLLLGNRADTKALWDENEKCITEGIFQLKGTRLKRLFESADLDFEEQTVIRREISPNGKSRAFINDTPVTLEVMRKIGARLMDIHSQHETLELADRIFQLELIDLYAGNEPLVEEYQSLWKSYQTAKREYERLVQESTQLKQEADFVLFQFKELSEANLEETEQEKLESELKIMENAEYIKTQLNAILDQVQRGEFSASSTLASAKAGFHSIIGFSETYQQLFQRLESIRIELKDIASELENAEEQVEFDAERTTEVKDRLSLIYQLLQKHRLADIKGLIQLQNSLQEKANKTYHLDESLTKAHAQLRNALAQTEECAQKLAKAREKVFKPLSKKLVDLLIELGIPNAQLMVDHTTTDLTATGIDSVEILFSANKGIAPKPLAQVASGGEFARLMFALKYVMAEKVSLPTLILDEIDTGVSGEVSMQLGRLMKEMGKRHQLIAISHLPQIAAKADTHYFVFKDDTASKTISKIKKLSDQERIQEIAKMIGGASPSIKAMENARELIGNMG